MAGRNPLSARRRAYITRGRIIAYFPMQCPKIHKERSAYSGNRVSNVHKEKDAQGEKPAFVSGLLCRAGH